MLRGGLGMGSSVQWPTSTTTRRKRDPAKTSGAVRRGRTRRRADLRRPATRRSAPPLRPAARAQRGPRELGRPEGASVPGGRAAPRGARRGSPARLRDVRGRDPGRRVRRRNGRDLGSGHVRAPRGEAERRPDHPPRRRARAGRLDARPGAPRRRRAELAAPAEGGDGRRRGRLRPAARPARGRLPKGEGGSTSRSGTATGRSSPSPVGKRPSRAATAPISPSASATSPGRLRWRSARPPPYSTARSVRSTRTGRRGSRRSRAASGRLILMAFDLLAVDDEPVHTLPLAERRERLEELLDPAVDGVRRLAGVRGRRGASRGGARAGPRGGRRQAGRRSVSAPGGARPSGRS